jgi:hypothetical protein
MTGLELANIQGILYTMTYRLHIDIPIEAFSVEEAQEKARGILNELSIREDAQMGHLVEEINYRLGHDDDRQRSNYLDIDTRGHCSSKKSKVRFR